MPTAINFCVRCGHALERREAFGAVRPMCPACGRIHFIDPKVAVGVIIEHVGQLLLVQRKYNPEQGKWSIPAGFVEGGEDPARAAEREAREETGLIVETTQLLEVIAKSLPNEGADILIVYRARIVGGALQAGDDAAHAAYFGPDNWPPVAFASTRAILARWPSALPTAGVTASA
jgi:ADP-ribose pyrophosphatase YjhB (NUDIX family)